MKKKALKLVIRYLVSIIIILVLIFSCQKKEINLPIGLSILSREGIFGKAAYNGVMMAIEEKEAQGGLILNGQKYHFVVKISETSINPHEAAASALELIHKNHVHVVIGPQLSPMAIPFVKIAEQAKIPVITTLATNMRITRDKEYIFQISFNDSIQGSVMAKFAIEELNAKSASLLYDITQNYSCEISGFFKDQFVQCGGKIYDELTFTSDIRDFTDHLEKIKKNEPDILFLPSYHLVSLFQAKQARSLGIKSIFFSGDSWGVFRDSLYPPELNGSYHCHFWHPQMSQQSINFAKKYKEKYGISAISVAAASYDAFNLIVTAVENQNSIHPREIKNGLSKINNFNGITGEINYQSTNIPQKTILITKIMNGKTVVYKTLGPY